MSGKKIYTLIETNYMIRDTKHFNCESDLDLKPGLYQRLYEIEGEYPVFENYSDAVYETFEEALIALENTNYFQVYKSADIIGTIHDFVEIIIAIKEIDKDGEEISFEEYFMEEA